MRKNETIKLSYTDPTEYRQDWNAFAREILGVRLDRKQREILKAIQDYPRVTVRSGHSRGKDYLAAVASLCFLYLYDPCKVIETAPTALIAPMWD